MDEPVSAVDPSDILVLASPREAGALREVLETTGLPLRYADPPSGDGDGGLEPSRRPALVLFPMPTDPERLAAQVQAVRDVWPEIPIVVAAEGHDRAFAEALEARDAGFVTQTVLARLVAAVDRGLRTSAERAGRRAAEETVRQQRSEMKALVDTAPDLIAQFDRDLRYTYVNEAVVRLSGRSADDFLGKTRPAVGFPMVDDEAWDDALRAVFESGEERQLDFSHPRRDRPDLAFEARIAPETTESGRVRRVVMVGRDVTEQRLREERIEYMSRHDPLTDLPNRRVLRERLVEAVHRSRRGHPSTLLFLDVDNFKLVNDEMGHEAGDQFLVEFGRWLRARVRPTDLVARTGGDEFAVLLDDADEGMGRDIAGRLWNTSSDFEFSEGGFVFRPTVTIGAVVIDRDGADERSEEEFMRRAESAMRRGKTAGKGRIVFYRPEWGTARESPGASRWLTRLRAALDEDRLEAHLQPIVDIDRDEDGSRTFEALVRLREDDELLEPERFLPNAERFGLVAEIDRWMVETVLNLLVDHGDPVRISVNVSGKSVGLERLARDLEEQSRRRTAGLDRLMLEVTETAALHDFGDALRWMERIRELGATFILDDFGSGFASFSYLQRLPVETVKIDSRYTANLEEDEGRRAIVRSIVDVCHALERRVVAEAVEDEATLEFLRSVGVDGVQGYHIAEPRPASEYLG